MYCRDLSCDSSSNALMECGFGVLKYSVCRMMAVVVCVLCVSKVEVLCGAKDSVALLCLPPPSTSAPRFFSHVKVVRDVPSGGRGRYGCELGALLLLPSARMAAPYRMPHSKRCVGQSSCQQNERLAVNQSKGSDHDGARRKDALTAIHPVDLSTFHGTAFVVSTFLFLFLRLHH